MPGFLKLLLSGKLVCMCLCVSAPQAIKNYSHEMKSEQPIKQVILPFSFTLWHLLLILLMGGALVKNHVVSYFQGNALFAIHFTIKPVVHY